MARATLGRELTISKCRTLALNRIGQVCTEMTMHLAHVLLGLWGTSKSMRGKCDRATMVLFDSLLTLDTG
jgi:hypothetical protein